MDINDKEGELYSRNLLKVLEELGNLCNTEHMTDHLDCTEETAREEMLKLREDDEVIRDYT